MQASWWSGTRLAIGQPVGLILGNKFLKFVFHFRVHLPGHGILYITVAGHTQHCRYDLISPANEPQS